MKVILQRDVPKLGKHGDIVTVADGFARNYLFPRSFAVAAAGGALKEHKARLEFNRTREAKMGQLAADQAAKLADLTITIIGKVGSGTRLYGAVTAQDVADSILKERGVEVDKRRVGLADPIKTLGDYTVTVRLSADTSVLVAVRVLTQDELARRTAQEAADSVAVHPDPEPQPEPTHTADIKVAEAV